MSYVTIFTLGLLVGAIVTTLYIILGEYDK